MGTTTTTTIFKLLPIDWQALGAIATFLAVGVSFISLSLYKKREKEVEKKEIVERIIHPLRENLSKTKNSLKENPLNKVDLGWDEVKKIPLVYRLPEELQKKIKNLDNQIKRLNNFSQARDNKLFICFFESIFKAVGEYSKILEDNFAQIKTEVLEKYLSYKNLLHSGYQCQVGGKSFFISIWDLLLHNKNLDEYLEELKNLSEIDIKEIKKEQFIIFSFEEILKDFLQDFHIKILKKILDDPSENKKIFINTFNSIKKTIENDEELLEFFKLLKETYSEVTNLETTLENFLSKRK